MLNLKNLSHRLNGMNKGRCTDAVARLNSTLTGLRKAGTAQKMAQVLAFVANEVGDMTTYICETVDLDTYLTRNVMEFDAKNFKWLKDITVRHLPKTVTTLLEKAGWDRKEELRGANFAFYASAADGAVQRTMDMFSVIKWRSLVIISDRGRTASFRISSRNKIMLDDAANAISESAAAVAQGGESNSVSCPWTTLSRMVGYMTMLNLEPEKCFKGLVPAPDQIIDSNGSGNGFRNGPAYYTGTWRRPHLRRAHKRYYQTGKVRIIPSSMIHGEPVLLKDIYRDDLPTAAVNA